jgi:hypothetical protein
MKLEVHPTFPPARKQPACSGACRILPPRPRRFPNPAPALLALVLSVGLQNLSAADIEWGNTATDYNAGASWAGGVAPGSGDSAVFSSAVTNQPGLSANITNQQIRFTTSTGGWTLNGTSALSLTSTGTGTTAGTGSAIAGTNTSGTNTINAAIILGGGQRTTTFTYIGTDAAGHSSNRPFVLSGGTTTSGGGAMPPPSQSGQSNASVAPRR